MTAADAYNFVAEALAMGRRFGVRSGSGPVRVPCDADRLRTPAEQLQHAAGLPTVDPETGDWLADPEPSGDDEADTRSHVFSCNDPIEVPPSRDRNARPAVRQVSLHLPAGAGSLVMGSPTGPDACERGRECTLAPGRTGRPGPPVDGAPHAPTGEEEVFPSSPSSSSPGPAPPAAAT